MTLTTDRTERVEPGSELFTGARRLVVASARPHQGRWLVRFEGVDDRDAAAALRGCVLEAAPIAGDLWFHDLVGCEVVARTGEALGPVVAVQANPAHDLLELESGVLVPMVFVRDVGAGRIVVELPEGLLDL